MFVIALAAYAESSALATAALVLFLAGTAILFIGVALTASEIRLSNRALQHEAAAILREG